MAQVKSKSDRKHRQGTPPITSQFKSGVVASAGHPWVEMLIDPIKAPAAQIPDMWQYPTQATKLRAVIDVTTDAAGYAVVAIGHSLTSFTRAYTVTAAALTSSNVATAHTDAISYAAAFDRSRATCMGIVFTSFLTPETSKGMCSLIEMPEESIAGYVNVSVVTLASDGVMATVEGGISSYVYPMEEPVFSTSHTYWTSFPTSVFVVKGAQASTTLGQLEITFNLEGVADPSSVHAGGSEVEPYDPGAHTIGTHVTQSMPSSRTMSGGPRRLSSAGRQIANTSAALLGASLGGATGAAVSASPALYRELRRKLKKQLSGNNQRN